MRFNHVLQCGYIACMHQLAHFTLLEPLCTLSTVALPLSLLSIIFQVYSVANL